MTTPTPIFSPQEVNTKKQPELDLLKTVTTFFMICIHVAEIVFSYEWEDLELLNIPVGWQLFFILINYVTPFGFMFSMGATIPFSRHQEARIWMKRGCQLILAWFILNLCYIFPLARLFAHTYEMTTTTFCFCVIWHSDIFFFAGTFFLFIGILRKLKLSFRGIFCTSVVLFAVGHFIFYKQSSKFLQFILANFICTEESGFPFLNWVMVPMLGICWGKMIRHCINKDRLYLWTGIAGLIGTGGIMSIFFLKELSFNNDISRFLDVNLNYNANIATVSISCCLLAISLSFYYAVVRMMKANWFTRFYTSLSAQLTNVYFIQWVIIPWMALLLPRPTQKMNPWWSVLLAILVYGMSIVIAELYSKVQKRKANIQKGHAMEHDTALHYSDTPNSEE